MSTETAESRLMGARYSVWPLAPDMWLSPYDGPSAVLTTAQAIEQLDSLLALPQEDRPFSLQSA